MSRRLFVFISSAASLGALTLPNIAASNWFMG
jgi:hypothetical protein